MKLYVMRHGPAEDHASSGRDEDRALTPSGRDRIRSVAHALVDGGEAPVHIMTSPLVRALQTAEVVAAVTKLDSREGTVEVRRELSPGGRAHELLRSLAEEGAKRVMVVGHEPDLSMLVGRVLGHPMPTAMAKGMVVGLLAHHGAPDEPMKLRFVLDPKSLVWDPDTRSRS